MSALSISQVDLPASLPVDQSTKLAVALAAGLLIGLEREWAQKEIGVRTFSITALLGAMTQLLFPSLVIATLGGVLLLIVFLNVHSLMKDKSLEMTTSISLIAAMILGAMAGAGHYFATATATVLITMLLAWKVELSRFIDTLKPEEIRGAALLGLLSFVIYPLLPNRFIDPWQVVNPQQAWLTVVIIAGIGFVNYGLLRVYGTKGLDYGAVLGGLVNSTATVTELSSFFKDQPALANRALGVFLLTDFAMFARNCVILAIFARQAVFTAVAPLGAMALTAVGFSWLFHRKTAHDANRINLDSPVSLMRVLKFGAIFLAIAAASTLAQRKFQDPGFLAVAVVGGLISSASTTASAASLAAAGTISAQTAGMAAVLASISSALVHMPIVYQQTRQPALTRRLGAMYFFIIALAGAILVLQWWIGPRLVPATPVATAPHFQGKV